jgi:diaminohydroxyphosphoribosylaminopyrimidine deaminase/5-amino-6-(5-phosphoribosylamino)uracil reductase
VTPADEAYLRRTLELAERGRRTAAPNPVVGCVLVRDGAVLAEGWHERPGAEHAEAMALRLAGDAGGATAYVGLEPCSHHGRTPPCADALIAAGVVRVVVAALDPNPKVNGSGAERLRAAGIEVEFADGEIAAAARRQNAAFRTAHLLGRPHVTYKAAASLDGRTATAGGESQWISSPESRRLVHEWRAAAGAVAVGSGTALRDRPQLTARDVDPPAERQPLRVVFDRSGRIEPSEWDGVVATGDAASELAALLDQGVTSVLVEGGATFAAGLLEAGLIDRVAVFVAPIVLGDGPGLFAGWAAQGLAAAPRATYVESRPVGPDILLVAELREV